jgi:hypothetical protein
VTTFFEPVDMARLIKDCLKTDLAAQFPELSVVLELPSQWKLGAPPVLLVADDAGSMDMWPAATATTIRVTSWTSGRDRTYVNAATARLLAGHVPGVVAILPGSGILEARDKVTGGDLASVIVQARARTARTTP